MVYVYEHKNELTINGKHFVYVNSYSSKVIAKQYAKKIKQKYKHYYVRIIENKYAYHLYVSYKGKDKR